MKNLVLGILWFCVASNGFGQPPATPTFEVASVKPSAPNVSGMFIHPLQDGGLLITGASLKNLISLAYNVRAFQISGGPAWVDTERFDIDARALTSNAAGPIDLARMSEAQRLANERLKNLLGDRMERQFEARWSTNQSSTAPLGTPETEPHLPADPDGPSIFTALSEQLGLRLESEKGRVEVLVIDRAERPSSN